MALVDLLKIHSDGSLLLTSAGNYLITHTLPEPSMYFDRLTITYGKNGDIDNGNELSERK